MKGNSMNNNSIANEGEILNRAVTRFAPRALKEAGVGTNEVAANVVSFEPKTGAKGPAKHLTVSLDDIEPQETEWLWAPYFPLGEMTLIQGNPGVGKSQLSLDIAMRVAMGLPWPEQTGRREPGRVLLLPGEDHVAKTIRPRLDALGLDQVGRRRVEVAPDLFSFDKSGLDKLDQSLGELLPTLVIVDPLAVYLGGKLDMNRQNEVRSMMGPLGKLGQKHGCAIVLVHHTRKAQGGKAIHQSIGSVDFVAAVRSAVSVYEYEGKVVMAHAKHNLSSKGPSLAYTLDEEGLEWQGQVDVTADELAASPEERERRSLTQQAMQWLADLLETGGAVPAQEIVERGKAAGFSQRTLESAKAQLGAKSRKEGKCWWWFLPSGRKTAERPSVCGVAVLQPS